MQPWNDEKNPTAARFHARTGAWSVDSRFLRSPLGLPCGLLPSGEESTVSELDDDLARVPDHFQYRSVERRLRPGRIRI